MYSRPVIVALIGASAIATACSRSTRESRGEEPTVTASVAPLKTAPVAAALHASVVRPEANTSSEAKADPTERWIEIDRTVLFRVADAVGDHLAQAAKAFSKHDRAAAAELKTAATTLTSETDGLDKAALAELEQPAAKLRHVAQHIDEGQFDQKEFDDAVRDAYRADIQGRWVLLDVDDWRDFYSRPDLHFSRAIEQFPKDRQAAATELAKVASYVRMLAYAASDPSRARLEDAFADVERLASAVAAGKTTDARDLQDARFEVSHALAYYHYHRAIDAWDKADQRVAARELHRVAQRIRALLELGGERLVSDADTVADDTAAVANRLERQGKVDKAAVATELKKLEAVLTEVGQPAKH